MQKTVIHIQHQYENDPGGDGTPLMTSLRGGRLTSKDDGKAPVSFPPMMGGSRTPSGGEII